MKTDSFTEQYKHPKWQKKRLEILQRDNYTCRHCESKETQLHVHHLEYKKDKKPWEYNDDNFLTLCEPCHKELTAVLRSTKIAISDPRFLVSVKYLIDLWTSENHEYAGYILGMLCEDSTMIYPLYMMLLTLRSEKSHASKISKTRNNQ